MKKTYEELEKENSDLYYTLTGVMHFVDKWLDEEDLTKDEVTRADIMREKTLQIVEKLEKENAELRKQPEIIHCAECIHFKTCIGAYDDYCICARDKLQPFKVSADGSGFCKWAERRTDE